MMQNVEVALLNRKDILLPSESASTDDIWSPAFLLIKIRILALLPTPAEPTTSPTHNLCIRWKSLSCNCVSFNIATSVFIFFKCLRIFIYLWGEWRPLTFYETNQILRDSCTWCRASNCTHFWGSGAVNNLCVSYRGWTVPMSPYSRRWCGNNQ